LADDEVSVVRYDEVCVGCDVQPIAVTKPKDLTTNHIKARVQIDVTELN